MQTATKTKVDVRWMIRRDLPRVLEIEQSCFEFPWGEDDFLTFLRQRQSIGMVAEIDGEIAGFMTYDVNRHLISLVGIAVHPDFRHRGVATAMIEKLKSKLWIGGRNRILTDVRETNLEAQLFFRAMGFGCIKIAEGVYQETDEPAYVFRFMTSNLK